MQIKLWKFELPLRHVFTISRGSIEVQETLIVQLEQDGLVGYGEATTNDYYGATIDSMARSLGAVRATVERTELKDPADFWDRLQPQLAHDPFAHCALDQAAHDLWGKLQQQPVYRLWNLQGEKAPLTNYTIGIDDVDRMVAKMNEFPNWPIYKIKLGTPQDLEIIQELRRHTSSTFRVDANCAWTAEQTIENAEAMQPLGVEFIEQPLPADRWDDMRRVHRESVLPLIADESCIVPDDVPRCQDHFHGVNVKLVKCGGMTPARRMLLQARQLGLKTMVGCMTESTVGISAIAQLLPLLDYVDMDGALLLARDIATGVTIDQGVCRFADLPGNGVTLTAEGEPLPVEG